MSRKSTKKTRPTWGYELKNVIAGWMLVFLCVIVFFGDSSSSVGSIVVDTLTYLYGEHYRPIFIVYAALAVGIVVNKLSWNSVRVV
jgi:hypothetical protein